MGSARVVRVTTITVGTNERNWLTTCLSSLLASDANGIELTVVYVDNASVDGSAELVASEFPQVQVIRNPCNYGFSRANNIGMRQALADGADYVFLVNPDTRTPTRLVHDLTGFMEKWQGYGIIGPMQYQYREDSAILDGYNEWSDLALSVGEQHAFSADWPDHPSLAGPLEGRAPNTLEHPYVQGSALFARADTLRAIGVFDEMYHTYYEEVDLCRRTRWAGWRVALTLDFGIQHEGGGGAGRGQYRRVQMRRNRYYYLLTDVDWRPINIARLALKWVRRDLAGTMETIVAAAWLAAHAPVILARRHQYLLLRSGKPGKP